MRVAYICDRRAEGCRRYGCRFGDGTCFRTTQPEHALFGAVEDPWSYPERFIEIEPGKWYEYDVARIWIWLKIFYNCLTKRAKRMGANGKRGQNE